jgi:DNA invertase Pin-like site-specific DNA recombinase
MTTDVRLAPKDPTGPLRVLVLGRISTPHQSAENIDASYRFVEEFLRRAYQGPIAFRFLGEQASGMRTDRQTIREAEDAIATGAVDLVIAEDLARFYRNPRHQYAFVQDAVDAGTRVICIGDNLDTADPNWEINMGAAALRHGLMIPDTRRRVKRTAAHAFENGGMVQKVRFGYRKLTKKEAAAGSFGPPGLRMAKDPECTPVLREMRAWVLAGDGYAAIAERLNERAVPVGRYVVNRRWTGRLVMETLRDPILAGTRTYGDVASEPIFRTGKHRRRKNPAGPRTKHYPELAHFTADEHAALLAAMAERAAASRRCHPAGAASPLYNQPRSRSLFPAQHARCGVCGSKMYRYNDGQLKCGKVIAEGGAACWNHVQLSIELACDKVLGWLLGVCRRVPGFEEAMVEAARAELQAQRERRRKAGDAVERDVGDLQSQADRLARAIALGGDMEVLVLQLKDVNARLLEAKKDLSVRQRQEGSEPGFLGRQDVQQRLDEAVATLARTSHAFADLMRAWLPEFVIVPVQAVDSGLVRPRARLTLRLPAAPTAEGGGAEAPYVFRTELDLFEPPLHIRHRRACSKLRNSDARPSLSKIAAQLGINRMTVKLALDLTRKMENEGLTEPYRVLTGPPARASRWRRRV